MVDIHLYYRFAQGIVPNSKENPIVINTSDHVEKLKEKIYEEEQKKINGFDNIDAEDLRLWKVEINNSSDEEFASLVLTNDASKNITKLKGSIEEYWDGNRKGPTEGCTHIIVDSPRLLDQRKKDESDEKLAQVMEQLSIQEIDKSTTYIILEDKIRDPGNYIYDLFSSRILQLNDVLWIEKKYYTKPVEIGCKVTNYDKGLALVLLKDEMIKKENIKNMEEIEQWLLEELGLEKMPSEFKNSCVNIKIIRDGEWLGSIHDCRSRYIKNQYATKVNKSRVSSVKDEPLLKRLIQVSGDFWDEYKESSLSCVCPGLLDNKPIIIASVTFSEDSLTFFFPAKFRGYKVMVNYGLINTSHHILNDPHLL